MDARLLFRSFVFSAAAILLTCSAAQAQIFGRRQHVVHSPNFIVFAATPQLAAQVSKTAEQSRRDLAVYWLGQELPTWSQRCPVHVQSGPQLGAGGETRFSLLPGGAGDWMMSVQGTPERILDSVLPHEITHTIFATHFAPLGKYVPRWADEGACTTVEHESEKRKHAHFLQEFLRTGRGLSFNSMFSLKEYPPDILPLYAQGHSAVQFLISQGGPRKFMQFLESGMNSDAWEPALREHYSYETIGRFQTLWNQWLLDGSPADLTAYAPGLRNTTPATLASNQMLASNERGNPNLDGKVQFAIGNTDPAPVQLAVGGAQSHSVTDHLGTLAASGTESWYKRRLRQVKTGEVTDVPGAANVPTPSTSMPVMQSMSRPQAAQSTGVQVLDWGNGAPAPGLESSNLRMVPIRR